jgi:hypothetical protein
MLLISADKAPATGCILFESVDGGRRWENISDDVADSIAALTEHAPEVLEQAPLAMFVPGRSALCTYDTRLWMLLAQIANRRACPALTAGVLSPHACQ